MKPLATTIATLVAASMLLLGLDAFTATSEKTLDRISRTGEFVIGYRTDASPLSYENAAGEPAGYSVDLCRRIAVAVKSHLGRDDIKTRFVRIASENRISSVRDGKIDIECSSTTITMERKQQVDFTLPTFVTGGSVLTLKRSGISRLADLANRKVGVVKDTTTLYQLREHLGQELIDATVVVVDDRQAGMQQLNRGDIDAFASDQIVLIGQIIESLNPRVYSLAEETFSYEPYGLVVQRNDADFRTVADGALAHLYRTGQYGAIYDKWIGRIGVRPSGLLTAMYQLNTIPE